MNGQWKSDKPIVPGKSPNKVGQQRRLSHGIPYTGTKVETPETAKGKRTVGTEDCVERMAKGQSGRRIA